MSRKFILVSVIAMATYVFQALKFISEQSLVTIVIAVVGGYIAGNIIQKKIER